MGLFDSLVSAAGQAAMDALQNKTGAADGAGGLDVMGLAGTLLQQAGGLSGVVEKFQQAGLGEAVQSWVGTGANLPVSAAQVTQALGPDTLQNLVSQLGGNAPQLSALVAQFLPMIVDQLTPQGQLPADNGLGNLAGLGNLGNLAGLASQFLQRG